MEAKECVLLIVPGVQQLAESSVTLPTARPCPFYSQGRCLFADSCNFLHDVKIKVRPSDITTSVGIVPGITFTQSPTESGSSVSSPNSIGRVRSPPRSPRLSSLLLALGDVIENDENEDVDEPEGLVDSVPPFEVARELIAASGIFGQAAQRRHAISAGRVPPDEDTDIVEGIHETEEDTTSESRPGVHRLPSPTAGITTEHLAQSGGVNELLSPIEVTLAPPAYWPLEQLTHAVQREDSVDSGYAEWTGPTPMGLSPPRSPSSKRFSTLDLLASPFGTPSRVISPKFVPSQVSAWPTSPLLSPSFSGGSPPHSSPKNVDDSDDLDSPSTYAAERLQREQARHTGSEVDFESTVRLPDTSLAGGEFSSNELDAILAPSHGEFVPSDSSSIIPLPTGDVELLDTVRPANVVILSSPSVTEGGDDNDAYSEESFLPYMASHNTSSPPPVFSPPPLIPAGITIDPSGMSPRGRPVVISPDGQDTQRDATKSPSLKRRSTLQVFTSPLADSPNNIDQGEGPSTTSYSVSPSVSTRSPSRLSSQGSPSVMSRQSSVSDMHAEQRESRRVAFGFRNSMTVSLFCSTT